jgi:uncharacterized protein YqeY
MLQDDIRTHLTAAMKAKEEPRLTVLRGLISACTQELTATKRTPQDKLSDDEVLVLIKRSVKQRKEAAEQFRKGGREDLAQKEEQEALILSEYLPAQASFEEIQAAAEQVRQRLDVTDPSKAGILVGAVMKELKGRADGAVVKEIVERLLKK